MSYLFPAKPLLEGFTPIVAPPQGDLRFLTMGRLLFNKEGGSYHTHTAASEMVIDVLQGVCSVHIVTIDTTLEFSSVGDRIEPTAGPPEMVYIPSNAEVVITALQCPFAAVVVLTPADHTASPVLVSTTDVERVHFGHGNWAREVYPSIATNVDAGRIMMGETHTPSGNWSSYPPHKHDKNRPPAETISEELYHFIFDPMQGFGMQYLWTAPGEPEPINDAYAVHNGDTVAIPRGYHPTVAAPGFKMVTVWAFAGDTRLWGAWAADENIAKLLDDS